jgi:hypothetical protein
VSEGLPAAEAGAGFAEPASPAQRRGTHEGRERAISIAEAILLSIVTLMAAWSGYAAAKWSTESRVMLAEASGARVNASRATLEAMELRTFDSSAFEAWFAAYTADNPQAMAIAERRFRPEFAVAFDAWRATDPETNLDAPRGPTYMAEYRQPALDEAKALEARAERTFAAGEKAGETADKYVRTTVYLASVLFLVGISAHFPLRGVRYGLVGLGAVLLLASLVQLTQLPGPPS